MTAIKQSVQANAFLKRTKKMTANLGGSHKAMLRLQRNSAINTVLRAAVTLSLSKCHLLLRCFFASGYAACFRAFFFSFFFFKN